jgi:hypothetical protein
MSGVYSKAHVRKWREEQRKSAAASASPAADANEPAAPPTASPGVDNLAQKRSRAEQPRASYPPKRKRYTQSVLDLGQRGVDWTSCAKCGMQYVGGATADVRQHRASCKRLADRVAIGLPGLNFAHWDDVYSDVEAGGLATLPDGSRVIGVRGGSTRNFRRLAAIDAFVCESLGAGTENLKSLPQTWMALLYVHAASRRVAAFALVQSVCGGRVARIDGDGRAQLVTDASRVQQAMVGVRRVWVAKEHRRKYLGTRLLEVATRYLLPERALAHCAVAFTTPTQAGASFAIGYYREKNHGLALCGLDCDEIFVYDDADLAR